MVEDHLRYYDRAVAFLDVLGFKQKLIAFEIEAIESGQDADFDVEEDSTTSFYSAKAEDFIKTFTSAVSLLDESKFRYYLFSDNICITSIAKTTSNDLMELLTVIATLFYEFAIKGFFLRGGIDYGKFIDLDSIAIGVPLANAYEIENKKAVYPRILLSNEFIKQFEYYNSREEAAFKSEYVDSLIKQSCELKFLNVFVQVFKVGDREEFFSTLRHSIETNLLENGNSERIYLKFKWLADQFNNFIDDYTDYLAYIDTSFDPTEEHIEFVNKQIITNGQ